MITKKHLQTKKAPAKKTYHRNRQQKKAAVKRNNTSQ
jgi:hypothetical protein